MRIWNKPPGEIQKIKTYRQVVRLLYCVSSRRWRILKKFPGA